MTKTIGKIEIQKISKNVSGKTAVLTITPTDEFFKRAFGHNPGSQHIRLDIVCHIDYVDAITKAIGIPLTEESNVPSSRSGVDE